MLCGQRRKVKDFFIKFTKKSHFADFLTEQTLDFVLHRLFCGLAEMHIAQTLKNELKEMNENNVVISFIGDTTKLSPKLQEILRNSVETTKNNTGVNLQIAFNYGSRDEIVHAVREIIASGEKDITEDTISKHLYTRNIPDPDLLIRTGGEMRVSNYLLWQIAYSEFIVLSKFWPEFDKDVLAECILEYKRRNRRFGK